MTRSVLPLAVLLLLGAAAVTSAQDVTFEAVERSVRSAITRARIHVDASGDVTFSRSGVGVVLSTIDGRATASELRALDAAVRSARLHELPASLTPASAPAGGATFSLVVEGARPSTTRGAYGLEGRYAARLKLVNDVLDVIGARLAAPAAETEVTGTVRVVEDQVYLIEQRYKRFRVTDPAVADVLREFPGRDVKVTGTVAPHSSALPTASSPLTIDVAVTSILSPQRRTGESVQVQAGTKLVFVLGDKVATFGPLASALRHLTGRSHKADGWLWLDPAGRPLELYVESLDARARQATTLTRYGLWAGYVRQDQRVELLSFVLGTALVRVDGRTGFVNSAHLEVGEVPVPLHGPSATPGLSGALPGG